jgi:hypothetical protein
MIIDSDDEQSPMSSLSFEDKPEFEDEEDEIDPSRPYPPIIQYLDLNFGSAIHSLAVPPMTVVDAPVRMTPEILKEKMVFTVACADHSIRVISLPLAPPSHASKARSELRSSITASNAGNGKWGESVTQLVGHSTMADGVSMTFIDLSATKGSSGDKTKASSKARSSTDGWQVIVASHSSEMSGMLLFHRIPVITTTKDGKTSQTLSRSSPAPFQTQYLSSPATSISFNPSIFSTKHSPLLLVADKTGACRIYNFAYSTPINSNDAVVFATQGGLWLLALYAGFQTAASETTNMSTSFGHKVIVDAKWVLGGKAIVVLLSDGEWGIWDIEGSAPGSSKGILGRQNIKGGAKTAFSLSGWIDGAPIKSTSNRNTASQAAGKFAPMTPGTRRVVEPTLFSGRSGQTFVQGEISVARLPATSTTSAADECIAFWLDESFVVIPNILAYWEAQSRRTGGGNLFGNAAPGSRLVRIEGADLRGERCTGISQSVRASMSRIGLPTELLIVGEHRLVMVTDGTVELPEPKVQTHVSFAPVEQQLAVTGDLDVMDIDKALAQMENGTPIRKRKGGLRA